ncbi:hypothetical protein SCG7086_AQ_00190 [Chlamydiales bacterium SCGC AG-110-P3]|nr:hypothetical protein SCG7086_AQ_00190 [Chlamydiales bacterium SCGC AG-110-P3]
MCTAVDRSQAEKAVKKSFLKEDSLGQVLQLQYSRTRVDLQKVFIRLEIDTYCPAGANSIPLLSITFIHLLSLLTICQVSLRECVMLF